LLAPITVFPITAGSVSSGALTLGRDGNLWFPESFQGV